MKREKSSFKKIIVSLIAVSFLVMGIPFSAFGQNPVFSQEEEDFIRNSSVIRAASLEGGAPLQYRNSRGEIKGISINFLKEIESVSGLRFEYTLYKNIDEILKSNSDLIFTLPEEYRPRDILLSEPYLHSETILFYNVSLNPEDLAGKRFAMVVGGTVPEGIDEKDVIYFDDREDTIRAVNKGKADYGYANSFSLAFYALQNGYDNVVTVPQKKEDRQYCLGVWEDNAVLLSILNKSIGALNEGQKQALILSALAEIEKHVSMKDIFGYYGGALSAFWVVIIAILLYLVHQKINANKKLNEEIARAREREEKIKYLSFHDSLTGLYNRAYLDNEMERIDTSRQLPISIIMADINSLKVINDSFGHEEGDKAIQNAASILRASCRAEDVIARIGGDEFVIVLPKTSHETALQIVDRIISHCDEDFAQYIPVSIAAGCATKTKSEEKIMDIMREAEAMMYRQKLSESQSIRNSIISALQTSLHKKGIETREHGQRLVDITGKVGEMLQLSNLEMDNLTLLARYHDIGKIIVDEQIMKKKEALTKDEFEEIKGHSEAGYRIAESTRIIANIASPILYHHEFWDGTGYPHGLKGEEIPLLSRILAIADAYDAMTNDGFYRKAMSKEDAINELIRCSGKQFDPNLVPLFISALNENGALN